MSKSFFENRILCFGCYNFKLQWLIYLPADVTISSAKPPNLYCDNLSAIHIATNHVFHECTKHMEIDCHIIREKLQNSIFKLVRVSSKNQLTDFFIKHIIPQLFQIHISKLGMIFIYHPACRRISHNIDDQEVTS